MNRASIGPNRLEVNHVILLGSEENSLAIVGVGIYYPFTRRYVILPSIHPESVFSGSKKELEAAFPGSRIVRPTEVEKVKYPEWERLSDDDKTILKMIYEEQTIKDMAEAVFLSMAAIDRHIKKLKKTLGVKSLIGLAIFYYHHEVLKGLG